MTHPIFTPYYTIPLAMLSLWSLLFDYVMQDEPVPAAPNPLSSNAAAAL